MPCEGFADHESTKDKIAIDRCIWNFEAIGNRLWPSELIHKDAEGQDGSLMILKYLKFNLDLRLEVLKAAFKPEEYPQKAT